MTLEELNKAVDSCCLTRDRYGVLSDMIELGALVISNGVDKNEDRLDRQKHLLESWGADAPKLADLFDKMTMLIVEALDNEQFDDYLGKLYMMSKTSSSEAGQFFTPFDVSGLCAQLAIQEEEDEHRVITINEPSCGSGGMIIAAAAGLWKKSVNYAEHVFVDCGDIDSRCVHMAYVQLSLFGIPAIVRHQNTLSMERFDEWHTPALVFNWIKFRRYVKGG